MKRILVIGAGAFGRIAVDRLCNSDPPAEITVVDRDASVSAQFRNRSIRTVCRDGIAFLIEQMSGELPPDWIVPAIPKHVAYEWMMIALKGALGGVPMPVPDPVYNTLPNPIRGPAGQVYVSNADFICPDDCPEPETRCTCTGKPRPRILHSYVAAIAHEDFRSVVIVSRQLAPGVGGYRPEALREALARIKASSTPVLLTTACKCHGVMHAFKIRPKNPID